MPVRVSIRYPSASRSLKNASSASERASSTDAVIAPMRFASRCVPASAPCEARLDLLEGQVASIVDSLVRCVEQGVAVCGVAKLEALRAGTPLEVVSPQRFLLGLIRAGPALVPRRRAGGHAQPFTATGDPTFLGRAQRASTGAIPATLSSTGSSGEALPSSPLVGTPSAAVARSAFLARLRSRRSLTASSRARFACVCCFFAAICRSFQSVERQLR